jgi:small-conductance mechanosensitive channel
MRLRFTGSASAPGYRPRLAWLVILVSLIFPIAGGLAAEPPPLPPLPSGTNAGAPPAMDQAMSSAGWLQDIFIKLERELVEDITMLPAAPGAIEREWRTFDRNGSSLGALVNIGWVVLVACLALGAERLASRGLAQRTLRAIRLRPEGPTMSALLRLLLFDAIGLAVFAAVFIYGRHWLMHEGVPVPLMILAANVLIRWRIGMLIFNLLLRPHDPPFRLIALPDDEARRLSRFLSAALLAILVLVGFGRYGLMDEDSGAPHVVALIVVSLVCALNAWIVFRARAAAQTLIRGSGAGVGAALRDAIARAWTPLGMAYVAGVFVFYIFGLSLGLLSYFHAAISSLGVILVLLVLDKLAARARAAAAGSPDRVEDLVAQTSRRLFRAAVLAAAAMLLAWLWIEAIEMSGTAFSRAMYSAAIAVGSLFAAYMLWELTRLGIDRHLHVGGSGPKLPGDDDEQTTPGSRLQTMLPMLRAAAGALIAVIALLTVLSHLGIDTAPLIAGAGVFGLAISFGAQSLVRDIISGLFYIWDDAFRVGEYIDTGRLKGTVEALGIRSVKVRHHNGPLHTIPYGQLGAVTNQSRDFATIKFNLRLEPGSDIELVRKTAKRIGIDMQDEPAIASEVILPLKMQGITEVTETALVVRFKFTARPVKPSWVQREYLKRIYRMFTEKGITFASGALTLRSAAAFETETSRPSPAEPTLATMIPAPSRVA